MLHGVVLCGGASRRMGTPKALLPWRDGNLLGHAVRRLAGAGLAPLCAGPQGWADGLPCDVIADDLPDAGPLGGIGAALARGGCFVLAVDTPLLTPDEIRRLVLAGDGRPEVLLPVVEGRPQPLATLWPGDLLPDLRRYLGDGGRSVLGFLARRPTLALDEPALEGMGVDPRHLQGMNDPQSYRALLAEGEGGTTP